MKPLFKNITKYNQKNFEQFVAFHHKKYNFSYKAYTLIMLILLIYCIILSIVQKNIKIFFLFLVFLILFLLIRIYMPMRKFQKNEKKFSNNKENKVTFSFYNFYFTIGKYTVYYFKLHKVFETKDYFYLYLDEDNAALVDKKGFTIGSLDDFRNFIKKKCLFKYSNQT